MSVDKLVDSTLLDSDLTRVANAIRTKGGTSVPLFFPDDFITAIMAITRAVEKTLTGNPVNFSIASKAYLDSFVVQVNPVQSGSGNPSPSNVRPISGCSVANVHVSPTLDPDDGTTYTINLDGTRYGGTMNVLTGVLTVDRFYVQLTESTSNWGVATTGGVQSVGYYLYIHYSGMQMDWPKYTKPSELLCDTLPRRMVIPGYGNPYGICLNNSYVAFRLTLEQLGIESTATFAERAEAARTWLANNPTHICYFMEEPQTIQLTPQEVSMLIGENNVWADTNGDVTVEYTEILT